MPNSLKTIVDVSVWILFVLGCAAILLGVVALAGRDGDAARLFGVAAGSLFLSIVGAWFRKLIG
jgi:hypothetical protein